MTIEPFVHDVRLACRGLWRSKGFTAAAVSTLAVGMAGVTAMFALIQGVLLRPLPMPAPDRIVTAWKEHPSTASARLPFHSAELALIRNAATHVFAAVAAVGYNEPSQSEIVDESSAAYINTARVSGDFFDVLGVPPFLGRALTRDDDTAGSEHVLVIAHGLWQRRYGGAVDVIGRRLTINDQRFTIVGVMPPDVEYPRGTDAWMTVEARATLTSNPTFQSATRDELNAENALMLRDQVSSSHKIVLWAHHSHVSYNSTRARVPSMGQHIRDKINGSVYTIGLFAGSGRFIDVAPLSVHELPALNKVGVERLLAAAGPPSRGQTDWGYTIQGLRR